MPTLVEPFDPAALQPQHDGGGEPAVRHARRRRSSSRSGWRDNELLCGGAREARADAPTLIAMGRKIAETMVELFADLPPGHPFFEQFSFIAADDLPEFQRSAGAGRSATGCDKATPADQRAADGADLPLYRGAPSPGPDRRRAGSASCWRRARAFAESLPDELRGAIEFYDPERYNAAATVQDNILFGRLVYGQAQAARRVGCADRRGARTTWACARRWSGRSRLQCRHRRQAAVRGAAPEDRPGARPGEAAGPADASTMRQRCWMPRSAGRVMSGILKSRARAAA